MPLAGFQIPNEVDAFNGRQAEIDDEDISIMMAGFNRTGVVSGCAVSAQGSPDMTLAVAAGTVEINGTQYAVTAGNVTIGTADATNPRFDLITVDTSGAKAVVAGTAASAPVFPALPTNRACLAAVYVPANDTAIAQNQVIDKRVLMPATLEQYGEMVQRLPISQMVVYGHSMAAGGGTLDMDRDTTTRLASMMLMKEWPRATGGAVLHFHQAGAVGDGGYAKILQEEIRKVRRNTTLSAQELTGQTVLSVTAATGFVAGDRVHVGTGDTGASGGETAYILSVDTGANTITLRTATVRDHQSGEPIYVVPDAYINLAPFYLHWYGLNDLGASPITAAVSAAGTPLRQRFIDVERLAIARYRCGEVFENDHSSCVYTGTWGSVLASTAQNSGANVRQPTAANAKVTVHVPDNFPGGTVVLGFINVAAITGSPTWTFTVDGSAAGTMEVYANFTSAFKGQVKRFTGLAAGRHKIEAELTTLGVGSVYFDWWGIEAEQPPFVLVVGANRPYNYDLWTGFANARRTTTLTGLHGSGVSSFNVGTTASMLVGSSVTFEEGGGNAETLEVATVVDADTFTTTTSSTLSHANGVSVVYGMQDADIAKLNTIIQSVIAEFDSRVVFVDIDTVLNKDPQYFWYDGAHQNERGHGKVVLALFEAMMGAASLSPTLTSWTAAPTAPLPISMTLIAPFLWTNMPSTGEFLAGAFHRRRVDLRRVHEFRWMVGVSTAGSASALLWPEFSIDEGTTWTVLDRTATFATTSTTTKLAISSTGFKDSGWLKLAPEARADNVLIRVFGTASNSTGDPVISASLAFR